MEADPSNLIPPLKGLILAGGESKRMGFDKGLMDYHGMPQREYLFHLLKPYTVETFLSCRPDQITGGDIPIMEDQYDDVGPFGALLTAFKCDPDAAWLVIACDFPLVDQPAFELLINERDVNAIATSFLDPHTLMPEPWITILEPKIYPILFDYFSRGKSSLRGVLVDFNSTIIRAANTDILLNANTPEEAERLKQMIVGRAGG